MADVGVNAGVEVERDDGVDDEEVATGSFGGCEVGASGGGCAEDEARADGGGGEPNASSRVRFKARVLMRLRSAASYAAGSETTTTASLCTPDVDAVVCPVDLLLSSFKWAARLLCSLDEADVVDEDGACGASGREGGGGGVSTTSPSSSSSSTLGGCGCG